MTVGDCLDAFPAIQIAFCIGVVCSCALIARHNNLGLKDTLRALVGLQDFKANGVINGTIIATFLVPIGLGIWAVRTCPAVAV